MADIIKQISAILLPAPAQDTLYFSASAVSAGSSVQFILP